MQYAGYQTIKLDNTPFIGNEVSDFAVVVQIVVPGLTEICYPKTIAYTGELDSAHAWLWPDKGSSKVLINGTWHNMDSAYSNNIRVHTVKCTPVTGVSLPKSSYTAIAGAKVALTPTISPSTAGNRGYTWRTSNSNVLSVSDDGKTVTARASGQATLTVVTDDGGYTASVVVTVDDYGNNFANAYSKIQLEPGWETPINGNLEYVGDIDMFCFEVPSTGQYSFISLSGVVLQGKLYNSDRNLIASNAGNSGDPDFFLDGQVLLKGSVVYLSVSAVDANALGSYTVYVATDDPITSVAIGGEKPTKVLKGEHFNLSAITEPSNVSHKLLRWTSNDSSVIQVIDNSTASMVAVNNGIATITLSTIDGALSDAWTIIVDDCGDDLEHATVMPITDGIWNREAHMLEYPGDIDVVAFEVGMTGDYAIYFDNVSIELQVNLYNEDKNCVFDWQASIAGTPTVTYHLNADQTYYLEISTAALYRSSYYTLNIAPTSGGMNVAEKILQIGETYDVGWSRNVITASPVSVSSSDSNVAAVDTDGHVTTVASGTTVITAQSEDGLYCASCTVIVDDYRNKYDEAFALAPLSLSQVNVISGSIQYENDQDVLKFTPPKTGNYIFYFSKNDIFIMGNLYYYNDKRYKQLNDSPAYPFEGFGAYLSSDTEYYLRIDGNSQTRGNYEMNIQYCVPVTDINLDTTALQLMVGGRYTLTPTITPSNAYNQEVEWSPTNSSVVQVSENGMVTGVGVGSALVMGKTVDGGFAAVCEVIVEDYNSDEVVVEDGVYRIQNLKSTLYMNGSTKADNSRTFKQEAYKVDNDQIWYVKNTGDGYVTIAAGHNPGLFVTAVGGNNTNCVLKFDLRLYGQDTAGQKWKIVRNPDGTYRLLSKLYQGYAMAVFAARTDPGENIVMFEDKQTRNAKWQITPATLQTLPNGVYSFSNVKSGLLLDGENYYTADNTKVEQWRDTGGENQRWVVTYCGDGYYTIQPAYATGLYLKAVNGSQVKLYAEYSDSALWAIVKNADGSYRLASKVYPDKTAVVEGALTTDGVSVILFTDNGTPNGFWNLKLERQWVSGLGAMQTQYGGYLVVTDDFTGLRFSDEPFSIPWSVSTDLDGFLSISLNYKLVRFIVVEDADGNLKAALDISGQTGESDQWYLDAAGHLCSRAHPALAIGEGLNLVDAQSESAYTWSFIPAA